MAAPTPTARQLNTGQILEDGFRTLVTFSRLPGIKLEEIDVKPVGMNGGDKIDLTNMHNTRFRTYAPRRLIELTDGQYTCHYDPAALEQLKEELNMPQVITETYCDGSTYAFWGVVNKAERDTHQEGEAPTMTISYFATNRDDEGAEQAPVLTEVTGT